LFLFDYDLDGRLDMLQSNGHIETEINKMDPSQHYRQSAQLFWNGGASDGYVLVEGGSGDLATKIVGRGAAYADIDSDGDLDVILTQVAGTPLLLRNDQTLNHHWLRVKLVGKSANRDAIGAWVKVTTSEHTQLRQVMPTRSYLSQVELPITFGLGDIAHIDSVSVIWSNGAKQVLLNPKIDQLLVIEQD
ncbi:MAG: CRTAC1 family protein, partial [Candidatus Latescibacteria bacterium]|nr:CRTAC1 family protein [Candidatus Latescibacterota bacterium]